MLLWAFCPFGALLVLLQFACLTILHRGAWFKECLTNAAKHHESQFKPGHNRWKQVFLIDGSPSNSASGPPSTQVSREDSEKHQFSGDEESLLLPPPRSLKPVVKDAWLPIFCGCFLLMGSLMIYPAIAPYRWDQPAAWESALLGLCLIGNTVARFLPVYVDWVHMGRKCLFLAIMVRFCIFFPGSILIWKFPAIEFSHNPWFLAFCMFVIGGLWNGYAATLSDMLAVTSVTHPQEVATVSKLVVLGQLISCGVGQFTGVGLGYI